MRAGSGRKGVVVKIVRFLSIVEQGKDKVTTPCVMDKVAEELAAKRIVAHVLDDGATVGLGVDFTQLIVGSVRKAFEKQRAKSIWPAGVNDGFVSKNGIPRS